MSARNVLKKLATYYPLASDGVIDLKAYRIGRSNVPAVLDLTNTGAVARGAGPSNNLKDAAVFTSAGSKNLANLTGAPQLMVPGLRPLVVAGWTNFASWTTSFPSIVGQYNSTGNNRSWLVYGAQTSSQFRITVAEDGAGAATSDNGAQNLSTATWYFFVGEWRNNGFTAFRVNMGAYQTNINRRTGMFNGNSGIVFGATQAGAGFNATYFDGSMCHIGIYHEMLSESEQYWLYNGGQGRDLRRAA